MEPEQENGKYKPTEVPRFYPGRVSAERARQLENFEIDIDDRHL